MTEHLIDEYVWDGSGEPDELVRALEALLARYRFVPPALDSTSPVAGGENDEDRE